MASDDDQPEVADDQQTQNVKRHNLTDTELQQRKLSKLFDKIDVPVKIPEMRTKSYEPKPAKEFVSNVPGSVAGAGSGDFHVYRAHRKREFARIRLMKEEEREEREKREYEEKVTKKKAEDEKRTAKNRAKRQKRNQKKDSSSDKKDNKAPAKNTAKEGNVATAANTKEESNSKKKNITEKSDEEASTETPSKGTAEEQPSET